MSVNGLRPYPAYTDSGLDWLGEVPEHWRVRRVANIADMRVSNVDKHVREGEEPIRLCNYVDVYHNDRIRADISFMPATAKKAEIRRFRVAAGDVLLTKDSEDWTDIGVPALVEYAANDLVCGYHLAMLRPSSAFLDSGYLFRALGDSGVARQFRVAANGVTRYGLSRNAIRCVRIPLPPVLEQGAIVRYLDHADRRIRRYIRAKERLIELLEERKRALIHEAVTGRIDVRTGQPYPAYKDSGVEWLGKVPEHWELRRLGQLIDLTVGFPFKSAGFTQARSDIRLLRGVNIAPGTLRWDDVVRWPIRDVDSFEDYEMEVGDIVLGMDRPIIQAGTRVAVVSASDVPSLLLQRVARIRVKEALRGDYAVEFIGGKGFSDYLAPIFTGISVPHLSAEQIKTFQFALPNVGRATGDHAPCRIKNKSHPIRDSSDPATGPPSPRIPHPPDRRCRDGQGRRAGGGGQTAGCGPRSRATATVPTPSPPNRTYIRPKATWRRRPYHDELERVPGRRADAGQGERSLGLLGHADSAFRALREPCRGRHGRRVRRLVSGG